MSGVNDTRCRYCGTEITWASGPDRSRVPLEPSGSGRHLIAAGIVVTVSVSDAAARRARGARTYRRHRCTEYLNAARRRRVAREANRELTYRVVRPGRKEN